MKRKNLTGDIFGGLSAMLVALPSAIAFCLIIYAPLGRGYMGRAALFGMVGAATLGFLAPLLGGTRHMITGPCAPAAAVLSVFVLQLHREGIPSSQVPLYLAFVSLLAGLTQFLGGCLKGGKVIKYIPYPVVSGYLSGVGTLILLEQIPHLLGLEKTNGMESPFLFLSSFNPISLAIGIVTIFGMVVLPKIHRTLPSVILSLGLGISTYFLFSLFYPSLLDLNNNPLIIGPIPTPTLHSLVPSMEELTTFFLHTSLSSLYIPFLTLAALLSVDTLKTCVILDALTQSRHESNQELRGQGISNVISSLLGGSPGSGMVAPSLVNIQGGSQTRLSSVLSGLFSALALLFVTPLISWLPLAALSGVLITIALKMIDFKSLRLLKHRSTFFDFFVILSVTISAISMNLIIAAAVGTSLAIALFLREQIRSSVVRRKMMGNQKFSKKRRTDEETELLEKEGIHTLIFELQGPLFFGTADQLFQEVEPHLANARYIILEMRRVRLLDFTAIHVLKQMQNHLAKHRGSLILTALPPSLPVSKDLQSYLADFDLTNVQLHVDLESALEWVEDREIKEFLPSRTDSTDPLPLHTFPFFADFPQEALQNILSLCQQKTYGRGEKIFSLGDQSNEIYFLRKGTVNIRLPLSNHGGRHLLTLTQGDLFGEVSFLDKGCRSAEAVAIEEVVLYILPREPFKKMMAFRPEIGLLFFKKLAQVVSKRLRLTNLELVALEEE